jgi:DNA polymerase-3 subunit epsilon
LFDDIEDEYVVFDTETTGLNPKNDEILSIGAVKVKGNKILSSETFELYLKPTQTISQESIKIHQIRHCDVDSALDAHVAIEAFLHFIGGRTLVGYYLEFDIAMINRYVKPWLGITLPNRAIEISALYYDKKIARIPSANIDLRFDVIREDLGIPAMGKHDALNDALMSAIIFVKLQNIKKI